MQVQIDSREKSKAIKKILTEFDSQGVDYFISKLYVGDYMNLDNPRLIVDRKQNLFELCENVCQEHERFRNELIRADKHGLQLIFLCEHGEGIECLEDVIWWENPRRHQRHYNSATRRWENVETKATNGETLYKILHTIEERYGCRFLFCTKRDTGKKIIEILGGQN